MASAAPRLSPEIMMVLMPRCAQQCQRLFGARFGFVAKGHQRFQGQALRGALRHGGDGGALLLQICGLCWPKRLGRFSVLASSAGCRSGSCPRPPRLRCRGQARRARCRALAMAKSRALAASTTARASGCSLPLCRLAAMLSSCASSVAASASTNAVKRGLPYGQRAGFVKSDHVHLVRQLQRLRVFDQHAVFRRHARARHDGGGRGQPERAGAGDDQHRHGANHGQFKRMPRELPAQKRDQAQCPTPRAQKWR